MSKPKKKLKKSRPARHHARTKARKKRAVAAAKKNVLVKPPAPSPAPPAARDLWLEILRREEHLKTMTEAEVRAELDSGGFPANLINAFIERRNSAPPPAAYGRSPLGNAPPQAPRPPVDAPPPGTVEKPTERNPETGLPDTPA